MKRIRRTTHAIVCVASTTLAAAALAQDPADSLLEIARAHVRIAESTRPETMLWGRLGGSRAERESAHVLARQLGTADVEPVEWYAHRPVRWTLTPQDGPAFDSAMPAPFEARMPNARPSPIVHVESDEDWLHVRGAWAFVEATTQGSAARTNVRANGLYRRAVESGAVGFVFSLPTPAGTWRSVVPVDKPFALPVAEYPNHVRPIPCFSVDSDDGERLRAAAAAGDTLSAAIEYDPSMQRKGLNVIDWIEGTGEENVLLACHLDSFFAGANDDASGIAVLVGLARRIERLPLSARHAGFWLVGLSGHHDEGVGMRAFASASPERMERIGTAILLEHLDMHAGADFPQPVGSPSLNDQRAAYVGPGGWPTIEDALPGLVKESGLMTAPPRVIRECIADLFVVCDRVQPFCLMAAPPYYHTDRDTLDKITEEGLQRAVDFHMRLLAEAGFISLERDGG